MTLGELARSLLHHLHREAAEEAGEELLFRRVGGGDQPELWAYGNSRGDLRLLRAADHGIDAGLLGPLGRLRKFPRLADVVRESEARGQAGLAAIPTTLPE